MLELDAAHVCRKYNSFTTPSASPSKELEHDSAKSVATRAPVSTMETWHVLWNKLPKIKIKLHDNKEI
jgi:hypothetical protein